MADSKVTYHALQQVGALTKDGLVVYDLSGRTFEYANAIATELLGMSASPTASDLPNFFERVIPADRDYLRKRFEELVETSSSADVEFRFRRDDGVKHICANAYLLDSKTSVVLFLRDVSRPKQHEHYLVEFGTKKNTLLDTLVHNLSSAFVMMENLSREAQASMSGNDPEKLAKVLGLVSENSRHCVQIINDLWNEEHEMSPEIFVRTARWDIIERIGFVVSVLAEKYGGKKFVFTHPEPPLHINTDDVKLLQIITNLCSNAIKFTDESGVINIAITEERNRVTISVSDNGIGIPENLKPFVFDRKGIAGRTGLNGEKSFGMGLSICQRLATLLHGTIGFESTEGEGSRFFVTIPTE